MAEVVSAPHAPARICDFWPVDRLFIGYLVAVALLIGIDFREVPGAPLLLAAHAAGIALIVLAVQGRLWPQPATIFHYWYPLAYIPVFYGEMGILIPAIRRVDCDAQMASLDYRIWGAHPTVWLERVQNPWLTEFLQIAYTLFIPSVILVAVAIWSKKLYPEFRYYAFLVGLGFLASYVGYFLVPVRGPRFFLAHLQHVDLHGVWLFDPMQRLLNRVEAAHYDCFPSGHTEMTMVAWWSSRVVSKRLFAAFSLYTIFIVTATVYLRYHYTVDVFAGIVLAVAVLAVSPVLYTGVLARPRSAAKPSTEVCN
jgi:membrane-associated phospholipid phosphatase